METTQTRTPEKSTRAVPTGGGQDEAQIRDLIEGWGAAVKAKDIERVMAGYSEDLISFDLMPPLRTRGLKNYRENYEQWFAGTDGPIESENRELEISCSGDLACACCLSHVRFKMKDGEQVDSWMRWTGVFKKVDGRWKVAHEHLSVPIDMESDKALWTLKPEEGGSARTLQ